MPTPNPSHTLLVVFNRIGDLTLSTPLFRALAHHSELSLLTRPFGAPLLGGQSYVRKVHTLRYPNRGRTRLGSLLLGGHRRSLGRCLAAAGFDEVLIYETERGVIKRWLEGLFPGSVREMRRTAPPGTHATELYRIAAASVGCDMDAFDPDAFLEVAVEAREEARRRLADVGRRVIGVQMGSQRTHSRRPGARPDLKALSEMQWTALVTRLVEEDQADAIVFHGAATESAVVRSFLGTLPAVVRRRCHDFSTGVGLDVLPAMLAEHQALISVDTGPAHIAAAVGCPLLVFFGPTDPAEFAPRGKAPIEVVLGEAPCQFCHATPLYKTCRDNRCLNELGDDRLWQGWSTLRDRIAAAGPSSRRRA